MKNNLKKIRESKGITILELSRSTGLSRQTLYDIENENSDTKLSTMVLISTALETDVTEIFFSSCVLREERIKGGENHIPTTSRWTNR